MKLNPNSAIGFGRISQRLQAGAHWTLPRRTLWCVERKEQCANAEGFAKGVPNAIAESGFNPKTGIGFRVESPAFIPQNTAFSHVSFLPTILPLKQGRTMKSTFTISAVVLVHVAGFALIVGGCHTESGYEDKYADNTAIYSGRNAGAIAPAPAAVPAEARVTPVNGGETTAPVETTLPPPPPPVATPPPPPVAPPPPPVPVQPAGEPYIVKNGDTIGAIARRHGVSQKALLKANNLHVKSVIKPKQKLIIPPKSAASSAAATPDVSADGGAFHVVKRGETLSHIALRHKTTVSKLMALNGLSSPNIREGKKLRVPAPAAAPAPFEQPPPVSSDPLAPPPPVGGAGATDPLFINPPPPDAGIPPAPSSVTATPEPAPDEAVPAPAPGGAF
jgi:LysM repeat protein